MSSALVLRVENVGKHYRLRDATDGGAYKTVRESLTGLAATPLRLLGGRHREPCEDFWALRDVSFDVPAGEVVGIIGRNGAGKSTLLKILSRITSPSRGRVRVRGRVGSLLEVGTGFHPELTGRENIFLNGSILGMSRRDIARRFDEIVAFAEVEKFLDMPVKRYSSGMYVRLAFAVAAHLEPDVLIVDEVLAVGDQAFQAKCMGKMGEVARTGQTVLLVSHNMASVSHLCTSAVMLADGQVAASGPTDVVIARYMSDTQNEPVALTDVSARPRPTWAKPYLRWVRLHTQGDLPAGVLPMGGSLTLSVGYDCGTRHAARTPVVGVVVHHAVRGTAGGVSTRLSGFAPQGTRHQAGVMQCTLTDVPLVQGRYSVDLWFGDGSSDLDQVESAFTFEVQATDVYGSGATPLANLGMVLLRADWQHTNVEPEPA